MQDEMLGILKEKKAEVRMYLVNGVQINGLIKAFDQYVVVVDDGKQQNIIYKHAISTLLITARMIQLVIYLHSATHPRRTSSRSINLPDASITPCFKDSMSEKHRFLSSTFFNQFHIPHIPQIKNRFWDLFETHVLKLKVGND
ncbi:MAG: RNA chaperone Hfq [Thermodesulfobium sp.]